MISVDKTLKTVIFIALVLFIASLTAGCVLEEMGHIILSEGERYSISGTNYDFVVKEIRPDGYPAVLIDIYQNGQFVKTSFIWTCHRPSCQGCRDEYNVRVDDFHICSCTTGATSAEFLIYKYKNPG